MIAEIWLLVIMYYTPGGDYINNRVFEFASYRDCAQERIKVENTRYPFKQNIRARCVLKQSTQETNSEHTVSRTLLRSR